jgi:thiosulfate dehydrogenase
VAVSLGLLLGACSGEGGPTPAVEHGARLFEDPGLSDSRFNAFSCATCHPTSAADDRAPRIAASVEGVVSRRSWWGGYSPRLLDAVNVCLERFMRGLPLDEVDPRGRALYEYLVSLSPEPDLPTRPLGIVENVTAVPRGDPGRGREVYRRVCQVCHGAPHSGQGRLTPLIAIIPEASIGFALELTRQTGTQVEPALVVVEKVRHGRFFGVGGNMPPFSREALSDADLGAIVAYLRL